METTHIYTLSDPITNQVRYVGKANNVSQRYKAHLNRARKHQTHKWNWIQSLKKKGLKPIIDVIDIVDIEDWIFWETYWISQMKQWGFNLVNYTDGGDGCTFANQTSFKKGHKNSLGRKHTKESKKKIGDNNWLKGKPSPRRKKVVQMDLDDNVINIWEYIHQAAEETNSSDSKIVSVCKGNRKTHNKFKWKYFDL